MRKWRAGALFWTRLTTISAIASTLRANNFEHGANTQSHQPSTTSGVLQLPSRQSSRIVPPALVCGHTQEIEAKPTGRYKSGAEDRSSIPQSVKRSIQVFVLYKTGKLAMFVHIIT
jgi:hypothetical protein